MGQDFFKEIRRPNDYATCRHPILSDYDNPADEPSRVCRFMISDLRKAGLPSLCAADNQVGRRCCAALKFGPRGSTALPLIFRVPLFNALRLAFHAVQKNPAPSLDHHHRFENEGVNRLKRTGIYREGIQRVKRREPQIGRMKENQICAASCPKFALLKMGASARTKTHQLFDHGRGRP